MHILLNFRIFRTRIFRIFGIHWRFLGPFSTPVLWRLRQGFQSLFWVGIGRFYLFLVISAGTLQQRKILQEWSALLSPPAPPPRDSRQCCSSISSSAMAWNNNWSNSSNLHNNWSNSMLESGPILKCCNLVCDICMQCTAINPHSKYRRMIETHA